MTDFNLELATKLITLQSTKQFPVDFNEAWQWLGYSRKDNAKVSLIENFVEGVDFLISQEIVNAFMQTKKENILLTIDCFKTWGMMAGTDKGKQVRKYFLECERIAKATNIPILNVKRNGKDLLEDFSFAVNLIYQGLKIEKQLLSGIILNKAKKYLPEIAEDLEETRQPLINSTAKQAKLLTVTELGKLLTPPLSAVKTNQLLIAKGYQVKNMNKRGQKDLSYLPTPLGEEHSSVTLTTGATKSDTYQQLRWYDSIISLL